MRWWPRRTIRNRLTFWHGGFFFLGGLLLLTLTTAILVWSLWVDNDVTIELGRAAGLSEEQLTGDDPIGEVEKATTINGVPYVELLEQVEVEDPSRGIEDLFNFSLASLAVLTVIAALFGFWSSGRMLRPVSAITAAAKRISESNLSERISLSGPHDELKDLADTFDGMLERLEAAFHAQDDFISNASHELRTPLAVMKTELDVNLTDSSLTAEEQAASVAALQEAVDRSELVINRLLQLAGSEVILDRLEADLSQLVEGEVELFSAAANERGIEVSTRLAAAPVKGDPALLAQMIGNIVQNAIVHNDEDGWVEIATGSDGDRTWLNVSNSGTHIAADEAERLFERFYRSTRTNTRAPRGVGLGLAIVRSIAQAHGGEVTASPRTEGGLEIRLSLPSFVPDR